jgi:hypothetical protein
MDQSQSQNQPGSISSDQNTMDQSTTETSKSTSQPGMTVTKKEHWKTMKTCTDENGKVLHKGDKGFKSCVKQMQKQEEMGGTTSSSSDMGTSGMSAPSDQSSQGSQGSQGSMNRGSSMDSSSSGSTSSSNQ